MGNTFSIRERTYTKDEVKKITYKFINNQNTIKKKSTKTNRMKIKHIVCY